VGSEEAKCREGLRVTYESEIEVTGFCQLGRDSLGGGFKFFLFSPLFGQKDLYRYWFLGFGGLIQWPNLQP